MVVASIAVSALAFAFYARDVLRHHGSHAVGDGRHVESYRFSLEPCLIPRESVVASGMPKDGLPALVEPATWSPAQADAAGSNRRTRFLVSGDPVIGVTLGGQARAYPLRVLVWHEVVNDTLGLVPILVTYNPLCDSAVAFRAEAGSGRLTFGMSGLLYDSNLLMYDRQPGGAGESLWSQLLFRAVAGPAAAAGSALEVLPISVEPWGDWRRQHPDTTVLTPDPRLGEQYSREPYASYFGSDLLRFPVAYLPSPARYPLKTPVVVLGTPGGWTAFPFPVVAALARAGRRPPGEAGQLFAALSLRAGRPAVAVDAGRLPAGTAVVYAAYFAWAAMHPSDTVWVGDPTAMP